MGKISTSPRYMIDITGNGSAFFGGSWGVGGFNSEKLEKREVCLTYERLIRS